MSVRITFIRYDPAPQQAVVDLSEQHLLPAYRTMPGFRRSTTALDHATGRGVSVTGWDSLPEARRLRDGLGPALLQRIADAGVQLEDAQLYEVVVQS